MVERQAEVAQQIRFVLKLNGVKPPHVSLQIVLLGGTKGITPLAYPISYVLWYTTSLVSVTQVKFLDHHL